MTANPIAESEPEPVAWRWRKSVDHDWTFVDRDYSQGEPTIVADLRGLGFVVEPLFALSTPLPAREVTEASGDWVLVPRKPTAAMRQAGFLFADVGPSMGDAIYSAMIAAAPVPKCHDADAITKALDEFEGYDKHGGADDTLSAARLLAKAVRAALATPARKVESSPTPTIAPTGDLVRRLRVLVQTHLAGDAAVLVERAAAQIEQLSREESKLSEILGRTIARADDAEALVSKARGALLDCVQALRNHLPLNHPQHTIGSADDDAIVNCAALMLKELNDGK